MSDIRLLVDEHIPSAVVNQLRSLDIDVVTVEGWGMRGAKDEEVLSKSSSKGRVVLRADKKDFLRLGKEKEHAGMIVITERLRIGEMVREVMKILNTLRREEIYNTHSIYSLEGVNL